MSWEANSMFKKLLHGKRKSALLNLTWSGLLCRVVWSVSQLLYLLQRAGHFKFFSPSFFVGLELIPPPHREPGSGLNVLNSLNHLNCSVSPRRQWSGACNLFEDCGDLRIARNLSDGFLMRIRHERRGFVGGEFFVFLVKLRIFVGLAERFLDYFNTIL